MAKPSKGDIVHANRALRSLLTSLDTAAFALKGDFSGLDPDIEAALARVRGPNELMADRLYEALQTIEQSPVYQSAITKHEPERSPT